MFDSVRKYFSEIPSENGQLQQLQLFHLKENNLSQLPNTLKHMTSKIRSNLRTFNL